eukprot:Nk52_evm28s1967 gene=Nk52_evmTU28s1967
MSKAIRMAFLKLLLFVSVYAGVFYFFGFSKPTLDPLPLIADRRSAMDFQDFPIGKSSGYVRMVHSPFLVSRGVPRIIHQSFRQRNIKRPDWAYCSKTWIDLMPDWEYRFWMDDDNLSLVTRYLPQYLEVYNTVYKTVMKADFARLLYMYHFGGVYADFDFELIRSLEEYHLINENDMVILGTQGYFLEWDHSVPNAFMMSTPGHPFWAFCINMAMDRGFYLLDKKKKGIKVPRVEAEYFTGPRLMYNCVKEYVDPGKKHQRGAWDSSKSMKPGETFEDQDKKSFMEVDLPQSFAKDRISLKKRSGEVLNFGHQGDSRVYLSYPWEFYPIAWAGEATRVNSTLTDLLGECYRISDSVGKVTKFKLSSDVRETEQEVTTLKARSYCSQMMYKVGAFAVTYWTHSWQ